MALNEEQKFFAELIRNDFVLNDSIFPKKDSVDWDSLFAIANGSKLFPMYYNAVKDIVPDDYKKIYFFYNHKIKQHSKQIAEEISGLYQKNLKEKVRFLLVKGLAISAAIYGDIFARQAGDIDVLVEEDDAIRMDYLVRQTGYVQPYNEESEWEKSGMKLLPYPIMRMRQTNHFFEYYKENNQNICVEIHKHLRLLRTHTTKLMWANRQINIGETPVNTLDIEHTFIFLLITAHSNSETRFSMQGQSILRDYVDIRFFLKKYYKSLDWKKIKELMEEYQIIDPMKLVVDNYLNLYGECREMSGINDLFYGGEVNRTRAYDFGVDFAEKVLDKKKRREGFREILTNKIFNADKRESSYKVLPESGKCPNISDFDLCNDNLNLKIYYNVTFDTEKLYFRLIPDERLSVDLDKFIIVIEIVNNVIANKIFGTNFELYLENGEYKLRIYGMPTLGDANVMRKTQDITFGECRSEFIDGTEVLCLHLLYDLIAATPLQAGVALAYQIKVQKYVYDVIYHDIVDKPVDITKAKVLELAE